MSDGMGLGWFDSGIILAYVVALLVLSRRRRGEDASEENYLLSGRRLTLPAFVATLVSTWYGGILGVGEFGYLFGVAQWFVFGVPYYLFAVLFAFFLARRIREFPAVSIPEAIGRMYGRTSGGIGAVLVFLLVNPAPYVLMVALLVQFAFGFSGWYPAVGVAVFSAVYVAWGGFRAVVRTDVLQVVLMFGGFLMLLGFAWSELGSPAEVWGALPDSHRDPAGGQSVFYILVWFFIALWTFVDPSFHQRAAAAKSPEVARNGILVSVGFWLVFDMLTMITALYGVVYLPELGNALLVYPALAESVLPAGLTGLFFLALLATIMSTLDSFLFLAGQTLGRDFFGNWFRFRKTNMWQRKADSDSHSDSWPQDQQVVTRADKHHANIDLKKHELSNDAKTGPFPDETFGQDSDDTAREKSFNHNDISGHVALTRIGIGVAAGFSLFLVWLMPSVIDLWYVIGSVIIPGLLIPVIGVYYPRIRPAPGWGSIQLVVPTAVSLIWLLSGVFSAADADSTAGFYAFLGIEPFYPGLICALLLILPTVLSGGGKVRVYESE